MLTQGLGTILEARHLVLLAPGESKADAVARPVEGPVSARCPASALQLHPHVDGVSWTTGRRVPARAAGVLPPGLGGQARLAGDLSREG